MDNSVILTNEQVNQIEKLARKNKSVSRIHHNIMWIDAGLFEYYPNNTRKQLDNALSFLSEDIKKLFSDIECIDD